MALTTNTLMNKKRKNQFGNSGDILNRYTDIIGTNVGNKHIISPIQQNNDKIIAKQNNDKFITNYTDSNNQNSNHVTIGNPYKAGNSIAGEGGNNGAYNKIVNEKPVESEKETTSSDSSDDYWKQLQKQIKTNTLNAKNEVAIAQRKASSSMDNYLKALGIQGTGLGQSQYANLASDYASKIADINADEQDKLLALEQQKIDAREKENDELIEQAKELLSLGEPADVIINELKARGVPTDYIERYANVIYDKQIITQGKEMVASLNSAIESGELNSSEIKLYENAIKNLSSAINRNDVEKINQYYSDAENLYYGVVNELDNNTVDNPVDKPVDNPVDKPDDNPNIKLENKNNKLYNIYTVKPDDMIYGYRIGASKEFANELIDLAIAWHKFGMNDGIVVQLSDVDNPEQPDRARFYKFHAKEGYFEELKSFDPYTNKNYYTMEELLKK